MKQQRSFFAALIIATLIPIGAEAESSNPVGEEALYFYKANIVDVYDGDTITADIDLGFNTWLHTQKFRLHGIDAPEVKGEEKSKGLLSRDFLRSKILGKSVLIQSIKDKKEKFGRYLAIIWLDGVNINEVLVKEGYAVFEDY